MQSRVLNPRIFTFLIASMISMASNSSAIASAVASYKDDPTVEVSGCNRLLRISEVFQGVHDYRHPKNFEFVWKTSGNIWGWQTDLPTDLDRLKSLRVKLLGDPFEVTRMPIAVIDAAGNVVKRVEISWNPAKHKRETYFRNVKLAHPLKFNANAEVDEKALELADLTRDVLGLAEPRLLQAILDEGKEITQLNWYDFEYAVLKAGFLRQERVIDSLYETTQKGWAIDGKFYETERNGKFFESFMHRHVNATWVYAQKNLSRVQQFDLGIDILLMRMMPNYEGNLRNVDQPDFAHSAHIDGAEGAFNFHLLDLKKIAAYKMNPIENHWRNLHSDLQAFVADAYQRDLGMDEAATRSLAEFTSEHAARIQYFLMTKQAFSLGKPVERDLGWTSRTGFREKGEFEHFDIQGSIGVIYSEDPATEPLSLEKYAGVNLNRKKGEKVAELIRLAVKPEHRDLGPKLLWKFSSYIVGATDVSRVFAITARPYAEQLIKNFGFEKVSSRISPRGTEEWVIQVTPATFFERSVVRPPVKR